MLGWFLRVIIWRKCPFGEEKIEENHRNLLYILQNIQKKTILFRKLPIYNKKPMPLRKGIGFCQQSEKSYDFFFCTLSQSDDLFYFLSKEWSLPQKITLYLLIISFIDMQLIHLSNLHHINISSMILSIFSLSILFSKYDIFFLNKCFVLQEPYLSKNGNMIYKSQSASDTQVQNY